MQCASASITIQPLWVFAWICVYKVYRSLGNLKLSLSSELLFQGIARTQSPLRKNYALESPAFGVIAEVNPTEVQWVGLTLGPTSFWILVQPVPGKYA